MADFYKKKLQVYVDYPEKYSNDVVYYNDRVVIIKDKFPKSKVHLLVLPRERSQEHPFEALKDPVFKHDVDEWVEIGKTLGYEQYTKITGITEPKLLQPRFKVGVHSVPSMSNLHIHIISDDFIGSNIKNKVHYNSFNTLFFVDYSSLPLADSDNRYKQERMKSQVKQADLVCNVCQRNFSNQFAKLKKHLELEFHTRNTPKK